MKQMLFVLNPISGQKKANRLLTEILSVFNRAGYDVHVHITQSQSDCKNVVCQRAKTMDLVVCCGGDGTFNETVAGVLESGTDVPIGYLPTGSTNDFAGSLHLPTDPVEAAKLVVAGTAQHYDVGSFGGRYFTYVASFGAFTRVSYATPQNVKNALGHTAYILGGIQELSQLRTLPVKLEMDAETVEDEFLFGAVCNSTSVGGILTLDPRQVDMCDGKFEVLLVRAPRDLGEITQCIQAVQRGEYNCSMITFRSVEKLTVTMGEAVSWTLDGEYEPGKETVEISNIHHAFRLIK